MWKQVFIKVIVIVMVTTLGWTSAIGQEEAAALSLDAKNVLYRGIATGARVRLQVGPGFDGEALGNQGSEGFLTGTLESYRDGVLVFQPQQSDADVVRVPMENVQSLYVSQGKSGHALGGAVVGLALGFMVAMATQNTPDESDEFLGDMGEKIGMGIAITVAGTLVGAGVGSAIKSEDWKMVYEEPAGSSLQNSLPGAYQVALGFSF